MHCATCRLSKQCHTDTALPQASSPFHLLKFAHRFLSGTILRLVFFMASFLGNSRGGLAPQRVRGRGERAPFLAKAKARESLKPDLEKHPLGDLVKELHISDLGLESIDRAKISDCQYVASYNWLGDEVPTIVVPGNCSSVGATRTNKPRQTSSMDTTSCTASLERRQWTILP
jgi:hypothetical protein